MRSKKQSQNRFARIMASPIRALGKARDMYVRSITNCGQHVSYYGDPMEGAGRFSRSHSVATSTRSEVVVSDDYAELLRAASARTLANRIDMDLVLKHQQQRANSKGNLPKSSSVSMARIDEDKPDDSEGGVAFVTDPYPRSRSYAVAKRRPAFETFEFAVPSSKLVSVEARK